jgi:RNA polymerase sigma factor (sigma-70 family)
VAPSDSELLRRLTEGDPDALRELYERCRRRLIRFAHGRLQEVRSALADAEGVADSAFLSFYRGVQEGRYKQLDDARDLWQLLFLITKRKAGKLNRWLKAVKRDCRRTQNQGPPADAESSADGDAAGPPDGEPPPAVRAEMAEECARLLRLLADETLQSVATYKWQGYTNEEIAQLLQCSVAKVERKLARIRSIWTHKGAGP